MFERSLKKLRRRLNRRLAESLATLALTFVAWKLLDNPADPLSQKDIGILFVISAVIVLCVSSLVVRKK